MAPYRENVPIDDPEAQAFLRAQKMQSEAETEQFEAEQGTAARRKTELEAVREAQGSRSRTCLAS